MFWNKIIELCNNNDISPSKLCEILNFSNATATKWKNGATPHDSTLKKVADYFNVPVDYLKETPSSSAPTIIPNDALNPNIYKIIRLLETKDIPDEVIDFLLGALEKYK